MSFEKLKAHYKNFNRKQSKDDDDDYKESKKDLESTSSDVLKYTLLPLLDADSVANLSATNSR